MKFDKNIFGIVVLLLVLVFVLYGFIWVQQPDNYINRPFSDCEQNFSRSYGAFQSCGDLMSDSTALSGLWGILLGIPVLTYVVLPLIKSINKGEKSK